MSIVILFTFGACDSYLDKEPSKSTSVVPTETAQLEYLFNNYSTFSEESNSTAFLSTDSYGVMSDLYDASSSIYSISTLEYALWNQDHITLSSSEYFFSGEYKKIFIANMVSSYLSSVSGTEEDKTKLEREAKFIRAYSLWELAQVYCLPYTNTNKETVKDEMGMTIKTSTSFEEMQERSTLEETYDAIESDLTEALNITNDMEIVNNKYVSWRANKAAVNAFAARFYLGLGDYEKALTYANTALESHKVLMDYNTDMHYSSNPSYVNVNGEQVEIKYPYTHDAQSDPTDRMEWKEFMYYRLVSHGSWWFIPSAKLLSIYNHDYDLRYKYHIVEHYSFDRGTIDSGYDYPGYIFFFKDCIPSGPTTAEVLLIKAECQARLGSYAEAMQTVNTLRDTRMDINAPDSVRNLTASSKEDAIAKIIEERWREMPFTLRWFDIRRLNNNDDSSDDVGDLTRSFYSYNSSAVVKDGGVKTYTLEAKSRRYACPINQKEIDASSGRIKQNTY